MIIEDMSKESDNEDDKSIPLSELSSDNHHITCNRRRPPPCIAVRIVLCPRSITLAALLPTSALLQRSRMHCNACTLQRLALQYCNLLLHCSLTCFCISLILPKIFNLIRCPQINRIAFIREYFNLVSYIK